ncbi:DUF427 domain-containing protein [Balneola sp. MJW-20]|uniref:DUF427 domain-containing protein n=1 Tax=Gracilimonas aurantiaca TaxID=3234185 RepID=UPI00346638D4
MAKIPEWLQQARNDWEYRGQKRPPFAKEPEPGQESVWDYPRPPAIAKDNRLVEVKFGDQIIARSSNTIRILETASPPAFYIPPADLNSGLLRRSSGSSLCEWKGKAVYWNIITEETVIDKAGWSYPDPFEEFESLTGYLSFYPSRVECFVDGEKVRPQPGGFYGGWITDEIVGPVKGEGPHTML